MRHNINIIHLKNPEAESLEVLFYTQCNDVLVLVMRCLYRDFDRHSPILAPSSTYCVAGLLLCRLKALDTDVHPEWMAQARGWCINTGYASSWSGVSFGVDGVTDEARVCSTTVT